MPRGDRTGPAGMGPMTGRAAGYCAGNNQPGFTNAAGGRMGGGFGWGRGFRGRGMGMGRVGRWFGGFFGPAAPAQYPYQGSYAPTSEQELDSLKNQADMLNNELKNIHTRISELESQNKSDK